MRNGKPVCTGTAGDYGPSPGVQNRRRLGACTLIARSTSEQGFTIETVGDPRRRVVDFDGLQLLGMAHPVSTPEVAK